MRVVKVPWGRDVAKWYSHGHVTAAQWHDRLWGEDPMYLGVVEWAARELAFERPYLYQREPNLRVHPPGGVAVPWHTDAEFGHLEEEWNVWVPLTETTDDSQRLWTGDFAVRVPLGSALLFHGAKVRHGNKVNTTDIARVSFDFRLLKLRDYRDTKATSVLYGVPLRIPEYWSVMR